LTLYSVIAWRIFYATMLARAVPEMPCSVLLDLDEWQALYCAIVTAQPGEAVRAARNEGTKGDPTRAFFKASNTRCPFLRAVEM
jgi:hypothetical protein